MGILDMNGDEKIHILVPKVSTQCLDKVKIVSFIQNP